MNSYIWLLVEINIISILMYLVYRLIKSGLTFWAQRIILISIPLLAITVVLVKNIIPMNKVIYNIPLVQLDAVVVGDETSKIAESSPFSPILIYWIITTFFLTFLGLRIARIIIYFKRNKVEYRESFSFFKFIHIRSDLRGEAREMVLNHEKIHAKKLHSLDLILMEVYHAFNWFNPIYFMMKKDLKRVHEFEVDEVMYDQYKTDYMSFLLSYSLGTSSNIYLLTNQFYSEVKLKSRIKSMKNNKRRGWKLILIIPLLAGTTVLVSWTKSFSENRIDIVDQKIEDEFDVSPQFDGGDEAMAAYMGSVIEYPESARKDSIQGTVYVRFVVMTSGEIIDTEVMRGVNEEIDAIAVKAVNEMPNWIPGEKDGKIINARMVLPIQFKL